MAEAQSSTPAPFTLAAGAVAAVGCLIAVVAPVVGSPSDAFRGSVVATGLVGLVFAAQNLRLLRSRGHPALAPAVMTTVFGFLYAVVPLLYEDVGTVATAGSQFAGVLTAAFGGYTALEAVDGPAD